jgi:hypothetical protein
MGLAPVPSHKRRDSEIVRRHRLPRWRLRQKEGRRCAVGFASVQPCGGPASIWSARFCSAPRPPDPSLTAIGSRPGSRLPVQLWRFPLPATVLPRSSRTRPIGEGIGYGKSAMTDHAPSLRELRFTFGAFWRVVVILSLVWAVGGSLDGADLEELIAVPLVMAVWALGVFILDRWVVKADQN